MAVWSVVALQDLAGGLRLDPEYYQPRYLDNFVTLAKSNPKPIGAFAFVTDGIHASPDEVESDGIRYLSAKCVKDNSFVLGDAIQISKAQHNANPRTNLREDDVLITTVGTIGNAAVMQSDILPANVDRHVGIIRLNPQAGIDPYYLSTFLNCEFGRFQSIREATGNVQLNLFIEKIKELKVPVNSHSSEIAEQTRLAYKLRKASIESMQDAEDILFDALGLGSIDLSSQKYYSRPFQELVAEGRFDAEFFQPKYQRLLSNLRESGLKLSDVATLSERRFIFPLREKAMFRYIEIGSLTGDGDVDPEDVQVSDTPSRATWIVKAGDVITSTVRPIRRLTAIISDSETGCVCSSGFAVLTPNEGPSGIEPEVLLAFLRLPLICEILDLQTTASMYPAIPIQRLLQLPIKLPDRSIRRKIVGLVQRSLSVRRESIDLLEKAKAAVETIIAKRADKRRG
jgi:restriction endonuclease S subunit